MVILVKAGSVDEEGDRRRIGNGFPISSPYSAACWPFQVELINILPLSCKPTALEIGSHAALGVL